MRGGQVRLSLDGPDHLRYGIEDALRAGLGPGLRRVDFDPSPPSAGPG